MQRKKILRAGHGDAQDDSVGSANLDEAKEVHHRGTEAQRRQELEQVWEPWRKPIHNAVGSPSPARPRTFPLRVSVPLW